MGSGRAWQGAGWTVCGFGLGGAIAGSIWYVAGVPFRSGELVALLFVSASFAAMAAMTLPLRRADDARAVAALAAWAAVAAFFGAPALLAAAPLPRASILVLLGLAPAVTGAISALGAAYLARGVRRARARRVPGQR